jgi:uncharacterized membrane protein
MNPTTIPILIGLFTVGMLSHFSPQFTRPDVFFGVTVNRAFRTTETARRILRNYRLAIWSSVAASGALVGLLPRPVVAFIIYAIGACGAQVVSHRRTSIHATADRSTAIEVDLSTPKEHLPGGLLGALLPFVALIGLGVWAVPHVDRLPNRLPIHWGLIGANGWVMTSPRAIIGILVMHAAVCLLLTAVALGVLHWSRRVSTSGPSAAAERQFRHRTLLLIITVEYFTLFPLVFSLLQAPALAMKVWSVALVIIILAFVINLMHFGQGGARSTMVTGGPIGDRTADARWIGGLLYFNPADRALMVEKRIGIGWTLNFGNPWSWVPLMGIAVTMAIGPLLGLPSRAAHHNEPFKSRAPSPGTEESLRRYIYSLESGHPNYEEMSPKLSASVKLQLLKIMSTIAELGEFQSLTYEGAGSDDSDVYLATFARGRLEWHIGPLVDGKVTSRYFRPLPQK